MVIWVIFFIVAVAALGLIAAGVYLRPAATASQPAAASSQPLLVQWTGQYVFGQDNYDEFSTIETPAGDFLGEYGMGLLKSMPGSRPKQVIAFDVGLFDKADVSTLSRVLMSEVAYQDNTLRAEIQAHPQAEAILAAPGVEFSMETGALIMRGRVEEMECSRSYFDRLKVNLKVYSRNGHIDTAL